MLFEPFHSLNAGDTEHWCITIPLNRDMDLDLLLVAVRALDFELLDENTYRLTCVVMHGSGA